MKTTATVLFSNKITNELSFIITSISDWSFSSEQCHVCPENFLTLIEFYQVVGNKPCTKVSFQLALLNKACL